MRLTKGATAALLAVVLVITVGAGFAAFTSAAYINASGKAGTLGPLVWGPEPAYGGFAPNDVCNAVRGTTTNPGDTLLLTASVLAPGDICTFGDSLSNGGNLPATVSEQITSVSGGLCSLLYFGDNFFSPSVVVGSGGQTSTLSHVIPGGSYIQWAGFISLSQTAGNSHQGQSCIFVVTLTGTAGT